MPKFEFEAKIGPAFIMSGLTLFSFLFVGGMIWAQVTGAQAQLRREVDQVNARLTVMQAYDTSIAVLQREMVYIRESMARVEQRVMKLGN